MENKYYTPEIGEFNVGFEYEYLMWSSRLVQMDMSGKTPDKELVPSRETWGKSTWTGDETNNYLGHSFDFMTYLENDNIRVKHLCRDDIESLEWEYVHHNNANTDRWHDVHKKGSLLIISGGIDKSVCIREDDKMGTRLFKGTIKNKSELKRVLKQLGI